MTFHFRLFSLNIYIYGDTKLTYLFVTSRGKAVKNSLISTSMFFPGLLTAGAIENKVEKKGYKPILLSTWKHGMAANDKAWEVLTSETGNILDAVEQGVRVTESDPSNLSVGLQGLPDREGIVTLDASIMKGDGSCGSVSFVRQIKHPI